MTMSRMTAPPVLPNRHLRRGRVRTAGAGKADPMRPACRRAQAPERWSYEKRITRRDEASKREVGSLRDLRRPVPPAFPSANMDEWGDPASAVRLRKLAETIAAVTRNVKRHRDARMGTAIQHSEQDLRYLHAELYVGRFGFE